jgi:hypothetical protein
MLSVRFFPMIGLWLRGSTRRRRLLGASAAGTRTMQLMQIM